MEDHPPVHSQRLHPDRSHTTLCLELDRGPLATLGVQCDVTYESPRLFLVTART